MAIHSDDEKRILPAIGTLLRMLSAFPYAISWARLPGGEIQYCNEEFVRLFGCDARDLQTANEFVEHFYLHERQREIARRKWLHFKLPESMESVVIGDLEIDIITQDGSICTMLHSGLILPDEQLGVAIYKDLSAVESNRQQLREFAYRDDLTGVSNRRGLGERWEEEITRNPACRLAFLMLDLDEFKPINDSHGHATGDIVLQIIAERLKVVVRGSDLVCRLGGDEFGILLVAPGNTAHIEKVCERILESVNAPIQVGDLVMTVGVSIGVCVFPDQASDKRELLQRADQALYESKKARAKSSWRWFADR
ncbi:putative signaling protein [Serratia plymuthica]|uniref:GGDEF domain-containing protein n=1 Tax=Serratia plymuthica TaxID=82996 RepID=UPI00034A56F9|nr:GGDEF domain-containing protein [Serratia plymuthica]QJW56482.1 putative signaling protein [Serratia plymuthica]